MIVLIKRAYRKPRAGRARGAKPGQVDERYMKRAEELLYGELAVALDMSKEEIGGYIAEAVGK